MKRQKLSREKAQATSRIVGIVPRMFLLSLIWCGLILAPSRASSLDPVVLAAELPAIQQPEVAVTPPAARASSTSLATADDEILLSEGKAAGEKQSDGSTETVASDSQTSEKSPGAGYHPDDFFQEGKASDPGKKAPVYSDWPMSTPPPQYTSSLPAPEVVSAVDYSVIPSEYDCAGTQAVLEVARTNYPEITIVFAYPGSGDPLLESIWQHFARFGYVAMTHEDNQDTRLFSCTPNCQFWNAVKLRDRGYSQGSVSRVMAHERVHNAQAVNDPELAIHINMNGAYGPTTQRNWNYQALIEGHAEFTGANVGPSSYDAFEAYYCQVQGWAEANGHLDLFDAAVEGHWDAFVYLMDLYEGG